jgi:hypothetical protein
MQLQYPELLWGLLLLILPILVHLLQLRRYRKTPFTNVKVLQKIFSESNRSSQLKKWLLLLMRLGLISALVIAFCKPYIPSETIDNKKDIVVYLDNSFSMQARWKNSNLLEHSVQEILQNFPEDLRFSFLTQSESFTRVRTRDLQQKLLNLEFSPTTLTAEEIQLRTSTLFSGVDSAEQELWVFSDFTGWNTQAWENWNGPQVKAIPMEAEARKNISIDSAYIGQTGLETLDLVVRLTSDSELDNSAISLYDKGILIAKTGVGPRAGDGLEARFTIPADTELAGTLQVSDTDLFYDNTLYVSLSKPGKIRVLSIGAASADYLGRIFTSDTFIFSQSTLRELDYSTLEQQHLIILNELETLPASLGTALKDFAEQAGNLIVIPSENAQTPSFNGLLRSFGGGLGERSDTETLITSIQFEHPVFKDVFEKEIRNFEYPKTRMHYTIQGGFQPIIDFQDGSPFLAGRDGIYVFAAPLSGENSNFRKSPLIVPTFYSIGRGSLPRADLYFQIGQNAVLDLEVALQEDEILKLQAPEYDFIPLQQSFSRKTRLYFGPEPELSGNYNIEYRGDTLQYVSFNYPRLESVQAGTPPAIPANFDTYSDTASLITEYQNTTRVTSLWKWFVILAVLFLMAEMILQKTMR